MIPEPLGWRESARCRGELAAYFFPPYDDEPRRDRERREAVARAVCASCPVQNTCLQYSLDSGERHGIWGGLTETERRRLRQLHHGVGRSA